MSLPRRDQTKLMDFKETDSSNFSLATNNAELQSFAALQPLSSQFSNAKVLTRQAGSGL